MKKMFCAGATLMLAVAVAAAAGAQEIHKVSGRDVAIYNLAGHVDVVRGTGADVVVKVRRGGDDAAKLHIETGEIGGHSTLRVVYPDDRIVYPNMGRNSHTTVRVRDDGTFDDPGRQRGDRVEIRGSGSGLEAWADLTVEVPAGTSIAVHLATGNSTAHGVTSDVRINTGSGSVETTDIEGDVNVDTGSGSVTASGVKGSLHVDTGSGSVTARDVTGDVVVIDTGSGGVEGRGLSASKLRVDTGSGSISLDAVKASDVALDTGSGSVTVSLVSGIDRLDVDTGSGGVTIRAPRDLSAEVELKTGSGSFDLDFPVQTRSVRRDYLKGTIGSGKGRIHVDTGSGGIRILTN